ncbi:MAG TPA: hypothetical protein VFZ17_11795 [Acidimicrobiia bacterium]|nr:hypothetical protein [Acidimicrobiia bacterium]
MSEALVADPTRASRWHVDGAPPWFESLATVLEPAPELLDRLFTEFAPIGAALNTQDSLWVSFHTWVVERLVGEELQGAAPVDQRAAIWAIYATSYWSMLELTVHFGVPPAVLNLGMEPTAPTDDSVADLVAKLTARFDALAAGDAAVREQLSVLQREEPCTGTLHGTAYNSGYCEVVCEQAPLGELPAHLSGETGLIRANPRDFMRLDYSIAVPTWLRDWRTTFEIAVRAEPDAYERAIVGDGTQKNLRDLWTEALAWGHNNWGGSSLDDWTQAYYDDMAYYGVVYNFGLEAVSLATFVALVTRDDEAALRALRGNTLYCGSWGAAVMGLLDVDGRLPEVVPA